MPSEDMPLPDGTAQPTPPDRSGGGFAGGVVPGGVGGAGTRGRSNILVERFKDNPDFAKLHEDRLVQLRDELYGSVIANDILEEWVEFLQAQASDVVERSTVEEEAARISAYFTAG